jgi:hypothetical protein
MFGFNVVKKVADLVKTSFTVITFHHLVFIFVPLKVVDVITSILMGV